MLCLFVEGKEEDVVMGVVVRVVLVVFDVFVV